MGSPRVQGSEGLDPHRCYPDLALHGSKHTHTHRGPGRPAATHPARPPPSGPATRALGQAPNTSARNTTRGCNSRPPPACSVPRAPHASSLALCACTSPGPALGGRGPREVLALPAPQGCSRPSIRTCRPGSPRAPASPPSRACAIGGWADGLGPGPTSGWRSARP